LNELKIIIKGIFISFHSRFEEIALRETKIITVSSDNADFPSEKYYLVESYCEDNSCDCRKVMINIIPVSNPKEILATIGYGWESVKFYEEWMFGDKKTAKELVGAYLELGGQQSRHSQHFLEIFKTVIDEKYKKTIVRHYELWKSSKR